MTTTIYSTIFLVLNSVDILGGYHFVIKVLEKFTKNLIRHSRLAFNNHESNIDCQIFGHFHQ